MTKTTFSKIKLHSSVDLITNSSTVIFTYSGGSLQAVKDLVNEMLKVFERTETFDDIFYAGVFLDDTYRYTEDENEDEENTIPEDVDIDKMIDDILIGKIEKPEWMISVEENEDGEGFLPDTMLYLKSKDEKYNELAKQLLNYLTSQYHEATNG